jgi:hypothetical protein
MDERPTRGSPPPEQFPERTRMSDDASHLDALDELFSALEEIKHDANVYLEHRHGTPETILLHCCGRIQTALRDVGVTLGPKWKM